MEFYLAITNNALIAYVYADIYLHENKHEGAKKQFARVSNGALSGHGEHLVELGAGVGADVHDAQRLDEETGVAPGVHEAQAETPDAAHVLVWHSHEGEVEQKDGQAAEQQHEAQNGSTSLAMHEHA